MCRLFAFAALLTPAIALAAITPDWSTYPGSLIPGHKGIAIANLDGTGPLEAVVTGGVGVRPAAIAKFHLATLEHREDRFVTSSLYSLVTQWTHSGRIQTLKGASGQPDMVVGALSNSGLGRTDLVFWSGKPLTEVRRIPVPYNFRLQTIGDIDGNGQIDAAGCLCDAFPSSQYAIVNLSNGAVTPLNAGTGSGYRGAAQLDDDLPLEIVLSGFSIPARILDGFSYQQQWVIPSGINGEVKFGNFQGDRNILEIATVDFTFVRIHGGAPDFTPITTINTSFINSSNVGDVNNDDIDEIMIGANAISVYSSTNGQLLSQWPSLGFGVAEITSGNLDGVGAAEVVYGTGTNNAHVSSYLGVIDMNTGIQRFGARGESGPFSAIMKLKREGETPDELVLATTESSISAGVGTLIVIDAESGRELRRRNDVTMNLGSTGQLPTLAGIDTNGDGIDEILAAVDRISVVDRFTLQDRWRAVLPGPAQVYAAATIRLNNDSIDDIVLATMNRFFVLDGRNGTELYRSVSFESTSAPSLAVGNADADPQQEVALSVGRNYFVVDPTLGLVESFATSSTKPIRAMRFESLGGQCRLTTVDIVRLNRHECSTGIKTSTRGLGYVSSYVGFLTNSTGDLLLATDIGVGQLQGSQFAVQSQPLGADVGLGARGAFVLGAGKVVTFLGDSEAVHRITLPLGDVIFSSNFQ